MSDVHEPVPFEVYPSGEYLHGTKAELAAGELLVPAGSHSDTSENGETDAGAAAAPTADYVYFTQTLDAATWGAELAEGDGRGRIYIVEPTGAVEDDPHVTDAQQPGNPTRAFRSADPVRVVGELEHWVGHSRRTVQEMQDRLAAARPSREATSTD